MFKDFDLDTIDVERTPAGYLIYSVEPFHKDDVSKQGLKDILKHFKVTWPLVRKFYQGLRINPYIEIRMSTLQDFGRMQYVGWFYHSSIKQKELILSEPKLIQDKYFGIEYYLILRTRPE